VINSGNSIMAYNLWKLAWYFNKPEWLEMANTMLEAMGSHLIKSAPWYSHWAGLQLFKEDGTHQIIIAGDENLRLSLPLKGYTNMPNALFGFAGKTTKIPLFSGKEFKGDTLIYPCKDHICFKPESYKP
jgi:uncharacterized protein YyaL (SSP411 family)